MELYLLLGAVGLVGGFLAGWVGLGGGIILAPLLLYVPPAIGFDPLDMKEVARLTILQSLCSTAAASLAHRRARMMHVRLVGWMGAIIGVASLAGAFFSEHALVSSNFLLALFATLALVAALMMLYGSTDQQPDGDNEEVTPQSVTFSRARAAAVAASVGVLGGMVGQSGAFLTIPLLIHVVRLPTRLAIGSSLGITFCAALAGSLGKFFGGGWIPWPQVAALVVGSIAGSQLGSAVSHRAQPKSLRLALALLIGASAVRMWYQVLS